MARRFTIVVLLAAAGLIIWFWARPNAATEEAYGGDRNVTVWSRLAQVREPVDTLNYGDRVLILERKEPHARVRTSSGAVGWIETRYLMPAEVWRHGRELREQALHMPVQAQGTTKVTTNVRVAPGRDAARIFQFVAEVPVEVLARTVVEIPQATGAADTAPAPPKTKSAKKPAEPERRGEDWLLVRGKDKRDAEVVGWVVGRFLEMNYPAPLRDYAAGIRFVAWFEAGNRMDDDGPHPTYVAVGVTGPEGLPCDFTLLRVYAWNPARNRYETAYVESNFCGRLPVRVEPEAYSGAESAFRFAATGKKGEEQREYSLRNGFVRRLRK